MIECNLDEDGCISLLTVLRIINGINEQQAWAICYGTAKLMQDIKHPSPLFNLAQIYIHRDGYIHEKSVLGRRPAINESELVASLGIALFWALDFGIAEDRERKLDSSMEKLILQSQNNMSLKEILKLCEQNCIFSTVAPTRTQPSPHINVNVNVNDNDTQQTPTNPTSIDTGGDLVEAHYRNVCKNFVNDAIELSIFLEKIYKASIVLSDFNLDEDHNHRHKDELDVPMELRFHHWARLWMQVIRELRERDLKV